MSVILLLPALLLSTNLFSGYITGTVYAPGYEDAEYFIVCTYDSGDHLVDRQSGRIESTYDTDALPAGTYSQECEIFDADSVSLDAQLKLGVIVYNNGATFSNFTFN